MSLLLGNPKVQYFDGDANFLSLGKLYSYVVGTTTPKATYPTIDDADALTNANSNPVILDAYGQADIALNGLYRLILKDSLDNTVWDVDNVGDAGASGNGALQYGFVNNAVNQVTIANAATGNSPSISATGTDTNVGLKITSKGSGLLSMDSGVSGDIEVNNVSTGGINVKRALVIQGTYTSDGAVTLSGTLSSGNRTVTGDLTASGNMSAGSLTASGSVNFLPAGVVMWNASSTVPTGWLACNGAAVSRTTYADLFVIIGTTFGSGDGSTTFNVPDGARRVLVGSGGSGTGTLANTVGATGGAETHALTSAEVASHTHSVTQPTVDTAVNGGASYVTSNGTSSVATGSAGSGTAHNNIQPSVVMLMMIKT